MKYPPFCPNSDCHNYQSTTGTWYVKNGTYNSLRTGKVQRYKCLSCGTGFSTETFSIDYFAKKKVSYKIIIEHLVTCSGIRDLSRILKVSCGTVTNRIARIARQSMALSASLCLNIKSGEDLVADGFESFVKSQYMPNNINILTGKDSQFWFVSDYAHLSRKGRMTESQKRRNERIKEKLSINRVSIYKSFQNIVRTAMDLQSESEKEMVTLYTDEHPQYKRVMELISDQGLGVLKHVRINSKKVRNLKNPLFSVNYIDREIRKDNSDHVRETVQFARNAANSMDRLAVYRMYHNFIKPYRINRTADYGATHGSKAGISKEMIRRELKTIYTRRRFLGKHWMLNIADRKLWCRCVSTPLSRFADYLPGYVMA